jgi:hypothetical protein
MKTISLRVRSLILLSVLLAVFGCSETEPPSADAILDKAIMAHGMELIIGNDINFQFRDREYSVKRDSNYYVYKRTTYLEEDTVVDALHSQSGFNREVNGMPVQLADSIAAKYSRSVNSVLYFFQLPFVLKDPAAIKEYLGTSKIKDGEYHVLKITFQKEGGGEDFEDEFRYWINSETYEMDYLAYSYLTDGGGVRFREAFNKQRMDGILFQDYRNYKPAAISTPLDSLPKLFEENKLELLSTIENTNIYIRKTEEI